jgi:heterodisulfide reductase subunit A-like polyferredoxin
MYVAAGRARRTSDTAGMSRHSADAMVIGTGHNGLVAAAMLADAGRCVSYSRPSPSPAVPSRAPARFPGT